MLNPGKSQGLPGDMGKTLSVGDQPAAVTSIELWERLSEQEINQKLINQKLMIFSRVTPTGPTQDFLSHRRAIPMIHAEVPNLVWVNE